MPTALRVVRGAALLAAAPFLAACGDSSGGGDPAPRGPDDPAGALGATARSDAGMVVTGSPYATEAGVRILEGGGNAVDAAVAAAFALAVAEPTQSGLGGRTQALLRLADGSAMAVDGTTEIPAGYDVEGAPRGEHGYAAVGIPGTVAALDRILSGHGTRSLAEVLEPARSWARDGIRLPGGEAGRLAGVAAGIDPGSEVARVFFGPGGGALAEGTLLRQPELADVLDTLAVRGAASFYSGSIARRIAADMEAHGGFVTLADLSAYRARESVVARGSFAGFDLLGSWLPASGATVIEVLQVVERLDPPGVDTGSGAAAVVEALLAGFEDREVAEGWEPSRAAAWVTSDSLAARRAREISGRLAAHGAPGRAGGAAELEPAHTTHISVADSMGNMVALTQSLGPTLGARVVTPGLGFLYASTMGGYLSSSQPGDRPWSSQAPVIVSRQGEPVMALGGAGARRIVSALVTTLVRTLREGQDLEDAMNAPRLHPTGGDVLVQESWDVAETLASLGYAVVPREATYFARLNVIEMDENGGLRGVGEPRWTESAAAGPRW